MATIADYNRCGKELEEALRLKTSPVAIKMLEKESDVPKEALRPKRDRGYHLAQCQAIAMARRQHMTIALLKEDHWCWAPLLAYGLVGESQHPMMQQGFADMPRLPRGKYIGMVTAPLRSAAFEPDLVLIYSDTAQLREILGVVRFSEKTTVKSEFDQIDSCVYDVVPTLLTGQYRITLPDPGEHARATAADDEIIFSIPRDKLAGLAEGVKRSMAIKENPGDPSHVMMQPDFPRPGFYTDLFKEWGLDTEK